MKRLEIRDKIERMHIWQIAVEIDSVIELLQKTKEQNCSKYHKIMIDYCTDYSFGDSETIIEVIGTRYESDEEFAARVKKKEKNYARLKKEAEEKERAEYERLKAKFGN